MGTETSRTPTTKLWVVLLVNGDGSSTDLYCPVSCVKATALRDVIHGHAAFGEPLSRSLSDNPFPRCQRTANMIASGGNRTPGSADNGGVGGVTRRRRLIDRPSASSRPASTRQSPLPVPGPPAVPAGFSRSRSTHRGTTPRQSATSFASSSLVLLGRSNTTACARRTAADQVTAV